MRDFDAIMERHQRTHRRLGCVVTIIFIITALLIAASIGLGVYAIFNPEAVGEFVGRIVNGFTATQ